MLDDVLKILVKDANLTNALATIASVIVAGAALVVSVVSLFVARAMLKHQRTHNVLSVKPIPIVTVADHENSLRVKVRNHGSGPLIIKYLSVEDGSRAKESLIDCMPDIPDELLWTDFAGPIANRGVLPGSEIVLIEFAGDPANPVFAKARDRIRAALARLTVIVQYTDIYDSHFTAYVKELSWFGR